MSIAVLARVLPHGTLGWTRETFSGGDDIICASEQHSFVISLWIDQSDFVCTESQQTPNRATTLVAFLLICLHSTACISPIHEFQLEKTIFPVKSILNVVVCVLVVPVFSLRSSKRRSCRPQGIFRASRRIRRTASSRENTHTHTRTLISIHSFRHMSALKIDSAPAATKFNAVA
jgi:hypothetical protein